MKFGSLFRFHFSGNMDVFFYHLLSKGIYIWEGRNCFLSTAHTDADLDRLTTAVVDAVAEMREGGFLPERSRMQSVPPPGSVRFSEPHHEPLEIPLSESQKHFWLLSQIQGDDSPFNANNLSMTLRLDGPLRLETMQRAFEQVVNRHESLRTTFSPDGNSQRINESMQIEFRQLTFPI